MKKRKRQPNNPQPRQREKQAELEAAAAKKRQEEDFACQLAAMFHAELGEERPKPDASGSKPEADDRRTIVASKDSWQLAPGWAEAETADLQDTNYFIPGRSRIKVKPSKLAASLSEEGPVDAAVLRGAVSESLRRDESPAEDGAQPSKSAQTLPEAPSAAAGTPVAPARREPEHGEAERHAAPEDEAAAERRPARAGLRGWLDRLSGADCREKPAEDSQAPAGNTDAETAPQISIRFDNVPEYSAEENPSQAPWEGDADWSDARLFSELDKALTGDAYSEALSDLLRDKKAARDPAAGQAALDAWLAYEPEPKPTPEAPSELEPAPETPSEPELAPAISEQKPVPAPETPAGSAEEPVGPAPAEAPVVPEQTGVSDTPSEPAEKAAAPAGRQSEAVLPPDQGQADHAADWREDSLPSLQELFGSGLTEAAIAPTAEREPEPDADAGAPEPDEAPDAAPGAAARLRQTWRKWASALRRVTDTEPEEAFAEAQAASEEMPAESTAELAESDKSSEEPAEAAEQLEELDEAAEHLEEPAEAAERPDQPEPAEPSEAPAQKPKSAWRRWLTALLHPEFEEIDEPEPEPAAEEESFDGLPAEPEYLDDPDRPEESGEEQIAALFKPASELRDLGEDETLPMFEPEPFALDAAQLQEEGEQLSWADLLYEQPEAASVPAEETRPERSGTVPAEAASEPAEYADPDALTAPVVPAEAPAAPAEDEPAPQSGELEPASSEEGIPDAPDAAEAPSEAPAAPAEDDFPELLPVFRDDAAPHPGSASLNLKDLLAVAVPMEEAAPPQSGSLRRTGRAGHRDFEDNETLAEAEAAAPVGPAEKASESAEKPAGSAEKDSEPAEAPSVSAADERPAPPEADQPAPADTPAAPAESESEREAAFRAGFDLAGDFDLPSHSASESAETQNVRAEDSIEVPLDEEAKKPSRWSALRGLFRGKAPAKPETPETEAHPEQTPFAYIPDPVQRIDRAEPGEPVPSAAVKTRREAEKPRPRKAEQEPEAEELPEETEDELLFPEQANRRYTKELSSIVTRLILTGLCTMISLFFTLYLSMRWTFLPELFSGGTTVYLLLLLLAGMLGSDYAGIREAVRGVREKRFSPMLLILAAAFFTALDTFAAAKAVRPTFTVVVGALLMTELWGRYDRGMAVLTTLKVLRAQDLAAGVSEVMDTVSGSRSLTRTVPDVERFMRKLETRDFLDRIMSVYTPVALVAGLVITGLVGIGLHRDLIWTGSLVFLGSVPVAGLIAFPRLFLLMSHRLSGSSAAICGYHGAEAFGGEHAILIGDEDIFPAGSLTLNGFKVYNGNPDRLIAYAAAAAKRSGSALAPLFDDLLLAHNGRHYTVDTFRFYDSGGIGATMIGDVVLMGSLEFMRRMGVHMDKGTKVRQAVYMSLNGELAAVFAIKYNPPENLRRGLASIANNRHFKGILVTRTFLGTPGFLKAKFGIPAGSFEYPDTRRRLRLSQAELKRAGAQGAILAKDSFTGFAQAAAGGRVLRSATALGALLAVLSGAAGLLLMGVLASLPAYETATAVNLLLYVTAWLAPTLLLTAWGRHF